MNTVTGWQKWVRHPQRVWLRRMVFQIHLWTGIGVGVYVTLLSLSGSLLVYRNELFQAATAARVTTTTVGDRLTDDQLKDAAERAYPGFRVSRMNSGRRRNQAVDIWLMRNGRTKQRLFDPYTGRDLGPSVPLGITLVSGLLDFHDNLLGGATGRTINGIGAILLVVLGLTGVVIWWPGIGRWRRSVWPEWRARATRLHWSLHSATGFWFALFLLIWGLTAVDLCFPAVFSDWADRFEPMTEANAGSRRVDVVLYWLAYLHFGRFGGRVAGCGRICNATFKAVWAGAGLAPVILFVTAVLMWWRRVVRPRWRRLIVQRRRVEVLRLAKEGSG